VRPGRGIGQPPVGQLPHQVLAEALLPGQPLNERAFLLSGKAFWLNKKGLPLNGRPFLLSERPFLLNGKGFWLSGRGFLSSRKGFPLNGRGFLFNEKGLPLNKRPFLLNGKGFLSREKGLPLNKKGLALNGKLVLETKKGAWPDGHAPVEVRQTPAAADNWAPAVSFFTATCWLDIDPASPEHFSRRGVITAHLLRVSPRAYRIGCSIKHVFALQ